MNGDKRSKPEGRPQRIGAVAAALFAGAGLLPVGCATTGPEVADARAAATRAESTRAESTTAATAPRGPCQPFWDALERRVREDERFEAGAARSNDEMTDLLRELADAPELQALLRCLAGSQPRTPE